MSISELPCSYCDSTASTYCGDNATQMPCVQWGTIFIAEPATMITDYLVGAACLCSATLLGVQHMRSSVPRAHTTLCWALGFGLLGASFVLAGSEHGFAVYTLCHGVRTCRFTSPLWIVSMILAVMAPSSMVCAYVPLRRPWTRRQQLSLLLPVFMTPIYSAVLLSGAAAGTRELMAFNTMVLFLAPVMIELFVQCFIAYRRASLMRDDTPVALIAQRWLASGLALVLVAQVWQAPKFNPSRWFNANDVSHTIFLVAVPLLYKGAMLHGISAGCQPSQTRARLKHVDMGQPSAAPSATAAAKA